VGSFDFVGEFMERKLHQPAMNVDEQIENLKTKGLLIQDEERAKSFLNDVSYFRVIKAYSLGLKERNGDYHNGVTFEQVVSLYLFNSNFRQTLFPLIEKVEINLRCRLANHVSGKYGVLGYLDPAIFGNRIDYHEQFMGDIQKEIIRNQRSPFIRNFRDNYSEGTIPFYALVEILSFGTLSKFFKNMPNEDKKAVASTFGVSYPYFESWIESIAYVRNICAHYGRLYNAKLVKTPMLYKQYNTEKVENYKIFAIMICLKHLLPNDRHWEEFVTVIEALLQKYPRVDRAKIGFPEIWKEILSQ